MIRTKATDPVALMECEHQAILALFDGYGALLATQGTPAARKTLADEICMAVTIHMRLENEMFYPVAKGASPGAGTPEATDAEHAATRAQIAQLLSMQPHEPGYDARVLALGQAIRRQVAEEREHLFPAVRTSGIDLAQLASRLSERRLELLTVADALREQALLPAYT